MQTFWRRTRYIYASEMKTVQARNMRREAVLSSDCVGAPVWPFLVRDPEVMKEITTFLEMSQILHFLPIEQ